MCVRISGANKRGMKNDLVGIFNINSVLYTRFDDTLEKFERNINFVFIT